jgi:hypothetical protein
VWAFMSTQILAQTVNNNMGCFREYHISWNSSTTMWQLCSVLWLIHFPVVPSLLLQHSNMADPALMRHTVFEHLWLSFSLVYCSFLHSWNIPIFWYFIFIFSVTNILPETKLSSTNIKQTHLPRTVKKILGAICKPDCPLSL